MLYQGGGAWGGSGSRDSGVKGGVEAGGGGGDVCTKESERKHSYWGSPTCEVMVWEGSHHIIHTQNRPFQNPDPVALSFPSETNPKLPLQRSLAPHLWARADGDIDGER